MSNENNIRKNIAAAVAAFAVSSVCILGTIGPVNAGPSAEQVQLADATSYEAGTNLHG